MSSMTHTNFRTYQTDIRKYSQACVMHPTPGPIFCLLFGVISDYAQPITGQVTEVTSPVIGQAEPELIPS